MAADPNSEKSRLQAHYNQLDNAVQNAPPGTPSTLGYPSPSPSGHSQPARVPTLGGNLNPAEMASGSVTGYYDPQAGQPTPPPYSGPSSSSSADHHQKEPQQQQQQQQQQQRQQSGPPGPQRYPGLPPIDYRLYSPPLFELLPEAVGIKTAAPYLSTSASALSSLIRAQATVPPKPTVVIRGNRGRKVDFEVRCNLMSLLVPEDQRDRLDYMRCIGQGEPGLRGGMKPDTIPHVPEQGGLEGWVRVFMDDQSHTKQFVLERQVANLDINWLEGQIRNMVATTAYKGVVTVKFPVLHAKVVVQSPDRVNKFFTSVSTLFTGKNTYEVVKAVWPFATQKNGEPGRRCVVQSEETWWKEWRDPIKYAIATKRSGWVTNEDKLEAIMEGKGKGVATIDWGPEADV